MGRSNRAVVASTDQVVRTTAWDHVLTEELAFDFSPRRAAQKSPSSPTWEAQGKGGVKEAIIRWLEEQL